MIDSKPRRLVLEPAHRGADRPVQLNGDPFPFVRLFIRHAAHDGETKASGSQQISQLYLPPSSRHAPPLKSHGIRRASRGTSRRPPLHAALPPSQSPRRFCAAPSPRPALGNSATKAPQAGSRPGLPPLIQHRQQQRLPADARLSWFHGFYTPIGLFFYCMMTMKAMSMMDFHFLVH